MDGSVCVEPRKAVKSPSSSRSVGCETRVQYDPGAPRYGFGRPEELEIDATRLRRSKKNRILTPIPQRRHLPLGGSSLLLPQHEQLAHERGHLALARHAGTAVADGFACAYLHRQLPA
jgi:hypothetical protein